MNLKTQNSRTCLPMLELLQATTHSLPLLSIFRLCCLLWCEKQWRPRCLFIGNYYGKTCSRRIEAYSWRLTTCPPSLETSTSPTSLNMCWKAFLASQVHQKSRSPLHPFHLICFVLFNCLVNDLELHYWPSI